MKFHKNFYLLELVHFYNLSYFECLLTSGKIIIYETLIKLQRDKREFDNLIFSIAMIPLIN